MTSLLLLFDTAKLRIIFRDVSILLMISLFVCLTFALNISKETKKQRLLGGNVRYHATENLINNNTHIFIIGLRTVKAKV